MLTNYNTLSIWPPSSVTFQNTCTTGQSLGTENFLYFQYVGTACKFQNKTRNCKIADFVCANMPTKMAP